MQPRPQGFSVKKGKSPGDEVGKNDESFTTNEWEEGGGLSLSCRHTKMITFFKKFTGSVCANYSQLLTTQHFLAQITVLLGATSLLRLNKAA